MGLDNRTLILIGVGLGVVALGYIAARKGAAVAGDVATAVNPLNPDNVFAAGVNATGAAVTGDNNFTLGGAIYDFFHPVNFSAPVVGNWSAESGAFGSSADAAAVNAALAPVITDLPLNGGGGW